MGISITELVVIFIVLLILFGPEQLPVIARQFGKVMADLKKGSDAMRREFYNSVYKPADEVRRDIVGDARSLKALKAELLAPPVGTSPALDPRRERAATILGEGARPTDAPTTATTNTTTNAHPDQPGGSAQAGGAE